MDIVKRVKALFEALTDNAPGNEPGNAVFKIPVKLCIDAIIRYYSVVLDEKLCCLKNAKNNSNRTYIMFMEKQRSDALDNAAYACSRLNEICREVNVDEVCDFDPTDRRKVAAACGHLASELFFSNIDNETTIKAYLTDMPLFLHDIPENPGALYYRVVMGYRDEIIAYLNNTYHVSIVHYQALRDLLTFLKKWEFYVNDKHYYFHGQGCSVIVGGEVICCWTFGLNECFETDIDRLNFDVYKIATTLNHLK